MGIPYYRDDEEFAKQEEHLANLRDEFNQWKANMNLNNFKDQLSKAAYGMTKAEAIEKKICIHCKKPISEHGPSSAAGVREYQISGIYGDECWDSAVGKK